MFTLVSMSVMLYALYMYHWRAQMIRRKEYGPYDDRVGPTFLCSALLLAVVINFWLRFGDEE